MSLDLCFKQLHVVHIKGFLVLVRHFLVRHFPVLQIPVTRMITQRLLIDYPRLLLKFDLN